MTQFWSGCLKCFSEELVLTDGYCKECYPKAKEEFEASLKIYEKPVLADLIDSKEIAEIDSAIRLANAYYHRKHWPRTSPVTLHWSPCSGSSHESPISYFLVWATDESTMTYGNGPKAVAYFIFKGRLVSWEQTPENYDSIESYVVGEKCGKMM